MSFHGGFLGVLVAMVIFGRRYDKDFLTVTIFFCSIAIGNFINMELPGRVTESSLGLVFQCQAVRELNHRCLRWENGAPSSLYQAATEGHCSLRCFGGFHETQSQGYCQDFSPGYGCFRFSTEFCASGRAYRICAVRIHQHGTVAVDAHDHRIWLLHRAGTTVGKGANAGNGAKTAN